jgi:hypothetical protein
MSWVDIRNWNELMTGYQKSSLDNTRMPGIGDYFNKIIEQNDKIIYLLEELNKIDFNSRRTL